MGVVPKEVWGQTQGALRRALKRCRTNICECLAEFIRSQMEGGDGLIQRWDNMTNQYAGRDQMDGHWEQVDGRQRRIEEARRLYDENGCGGGSHVLHPQMEEYLAKEKEDALREYEERWGVPMPETAPTRSIMEWEYWEELTGLTGGALLLYLIISQGSRVIPARNLVPVP